MSVPAAAAEFPLRVIDATVTIANGDTTSDAADLKGLSLLGVYIPAAFTGTSLTFTASYDGTNFFTAYRNGGDYSVTVTTSKFVAIDATALMGANYVKVVSGSAEGGARTLHLAIGALL